MTHQEHVPCVPFDSCPICLAARQAERAAFQEASKARVPGLTFMTARVAWHLANGCDSPEKARELAIREWRIGVLGESE